MIGIISVILIIVFSILITRIASIALMHTGLSKETSKFQARSAFTGVGFTTSESEKVVNHPVRRRILQFLMILGNAGIATGVASLIIGFTGIDSELGTWVKIAVLFGAIIILWNLANSRWVDRQLSNLIDKVLKRYSKIDVIDYYSLLHLSGEFRISEIPIANRHWLRGKKLRNTGLKEEGMIVLGISRKNGNFLGTPDGDTYIREEDSLIIYGRASALNKLEKRLKGDEGNREHRDIMSEQKTIERKEKIEDEKDQ